LTHEYVSFLANAVAALATLTMAVLLPVLLIRYFGEALGLLNGSLKHFDRKKSTVETGMFSLKKAACAVLIAFLASRVLYLAGAWIYSSIVQGQHISIRSWVRWDAYHYIGLIKNWYVNEGDPRFHIVFFPLYPLLGRLLHFLGIDATLCSVLVSNLACIGCGFALWELVRMDYGVKAAGRAVWLLMLCPFSYFFSTPHTESVFLLCTLLSVLFARKKKFFWAVFFGALSAYARILGMLCAVPIFWEMLTDARKKGLLCPGKRFVRVSLCVLKVLPVSLGLLAYIALNYQITGDPLRFLTYQSEHWGQEMGTLYNTLKYSITNAFEYGNMWYRIGVFGPQSVAIVLVLTLLCFSWRKLHAGDAAYALLYLWFSIAPTWLLSGCRYLAAMYALYPLLAGMCRRRSQFVCIIAVEVAMMLVSGILYSVYGCIM